MSGAAAVRRTAYVWHEAFMWHTQGPSAGFLPASAVVEPGRPFDTPEPKRRAHSLLEVSGLLAALQRIEPSPATRAELLRFHSASYLDRLARLSGGSGGPVGPGAFMPPGGCRAAVLSAGACIAATRAVAAGRADNAFALVRPPGHHARRSHGAGGCLLANTALAAMDARDRGASRVAIVDWDAHHGDGTQAAFWRDGAVLTVSIHQEKEWLPGTGGVDAVGAGAGRGCNLNIPLPVGSGRGAYVESIARIVVPAIRRFHPDLIIVGAGFDANTMDPSARMMLHSEAFREMTRQILTVADAMCEGKVVFCVEGGYSDSYVPFCVLATVEELAGRRTGVEDPFLARWRPFSGDALRPHQEQAIESARSALAAVPDHGLCPKPQTEGPAGPWGPGRHRRARDAPS